MADGDLKDDELELEEAEQPGDQQAEPEGDEPEEGDDQQEQEQPPIQVQEQPSEQVQRPSRRDTRIQSLVDSNRQKDTELADVRRRLDELTRQVAQPRQQGESPEQRAARFAVMTPQEQMQETLREAEQRFTGQLSQMQMQNAEMADRTAFQAQCAVNPLYAKYAPKVEGKLAELRSQGMNANREAILRFIIGDAALARVASKEGKREVAQAQQRIRRQTTRPSNSGSDTAATRRQGDSLERRLENLNI